jgi:ribosome-binding protein aMBF1 (putative translation factor)
MTNERRLLASDLFATWRQDPEFMEAYDALEEEFALAESLIRARAQAAMTQEDVAKAMGTTQAAIARLEGGRSMPSTRTLQRFAEATGTKLRIRFEKPKPKRSAP